MEQQKFSRCNLDILNQIRIKKLMNEEIDETGLVHDSRSIIDHRSGLS